MRHGSNINPANRFEKMHAEADFEQLDAADAAEQAVPRRRIHYHADLAKRIVTENRSPDIPFRYSVNPYRGCAHACPYCYARNSHEYLGLNAGLDFETEIFVKHDAPRLLREFLSRDTWQAEPITFSGITDCYQPAERQFRLTRGCLEVAAACHQPIVIITKNAMVLRDLDLMQEMAARQLVHVNLSITTLDSELAAVMEPRTSVPAARLRAVRTLADAGVPVRVMVAPLIPGLNDHEAVEIMRAARDAGAQDACYTLLRLPQTVEPVFSEWLHRTQPLKAEMIQGRIRQTRQGKLNQSDWGERMVGSGEMAGQIRSTFKVFRRKLKFSGLPELDSRQFRPAVSSDGQLRLF